MYNKYFAVRNVYYQRTICACLLSYSGFLRTSELLNLRRSDIQFFTSHICVFIEKSKTDIYRDGSQLVIARTDSQLCPVKKPRILFRVVGILSDSDDFLFRNLSADKGSHLFRSVNKPLSYSRMRELFIEVFSPFVKDIKSYGLHSLRSGGASAAASFGVADRLFKRHGRWKSDTSKDGNVKDSLESRLSVSKNL